MTPLDDHIDQEYHLAEYIKRIERHVEGRRAVHLHLSALLPQNRRRHHIRIAANSFEGLMARSDGQMFVLSNRDIVAVVKDATIAEIDEVVLKLRFLFNNDPLIAVDDGVKRGGFCSWYDLEQDYGQFLTAAEALRAAAAELELELQPQHIRQPEEPPSLATMTPRRLDKLLSQVKTMDIEPMMRRRSVCAITNGRPPVAVFNELFVSLADLQQTIMPDVDMESDRWLYNYLNEWLDRRALKVLADLEADISQSTSFNVNIATLLSPEFLEFDRKLRLLTKKTLIFELQPVDVFEDMSGYMFARDFVRARGYRICLDRLTYLTLPHFDRRRFGFDFEKLIWEPGLPRDIDAQARTELVAAVQEAGPASIILSRCDREEAIAFGHQIGITLFQGPYVDKLLDTGYGPRSAAS